MSPHLFQVESATREIQWVSESVPARISTRFKTGVHRLSPGTWCTNTQTHCSEPLSRAIRDWLRVLNLPVSISTEAGP